MLNDRQIREAVMNGRITVSPDDSIATRIQPASLDIRLGNTFAVYTRHRGGVLDVKQDTSSLLETVTVTEDEGYVAHPHQFILATTLEHIGLSLDLAARVEGKSSLGRLGLLVHSTAGFIDPGWTQAPITLELSVVNHLPIRLYPSMPIAQLAFHPVEEVSAGYSGKYVSQEGPTPSRFHRNWTGSGWT